MLARRSSGEVSAGFLASYAGGYAIWLAYGLSTGSIPLIVVDTVGLLCGVLTLAVALSLRGSLIRPVTWNSRNTTAIPQRPALRSEMDSLSKEHRVDHTHGAWQSATALPGHRSPARGRSPAVQSKSDTSQVVSQPPSHGIGAPLMYAAASEARKATSAPISSGRPRRRAGTLATNASRDSSGMDSTSGVAMRPGRTVLAVIPKRP